MLPMFLLEGTGVKKSVTAVEKSSTMESSLVSHEHCCGRLGQEVQLVLGPSPET